MSHVQVVQLVLKYSIMKLASLLPYLKVVVAEKQTCQASQSRRPASDGRCVSRTSPCHMLIRRGCDQERNSRLEKRVVD